MSSSDLTEIAMRLRDISRDDGSIDAAQVKLVGLEEIREAAGPRWPRMRERVQIGSTEILSRHTGPNDVVVPAGDGFLIVLAEGLPGANQKRCQDMRDALLAFYLGEDALAALRPQVTARSLSADGFADLLTTGMEQPKGHLPRIVARSAGGEIAQAALYASREQRAVAQIFAPVRFERGARRLAYNPDFILAGTHQGAEFLELDIALLDQAIGLLSGNHGTQRVTAVGFTVHASTLQLRCSRKVYLDALASVPPELRRAAFATIAEIEKGTPLISITEWCAALRSLLNRVGLDFHYTDLAIAGVGGTGAWAAGFHLPIHSGAQKGARAVRTLEQVRFWARTMHRQGMRLAVNGFHEAEFLSQAIAAGVDLATSDLMWPFDLVGAEPANDAPAPPAGGVRACGGT